MKEIVFREEELDFQFVKSSGPGGQHVNKTSSKVQLTFNLFSSQIFSETEKQLISKNLAAKIKSDGTIRVSSQTTRSQFQNKEKTIEKLKQLLQNALSVQEERIETKPTFSSVQKRIEEKKKTSARKQKRKKIDFEE
ncbi:aminoacyl-tRNA hydrolase [bacterium]|nr:aminoacyl-tRNA hydrolase [bacterium]